MEIRNCFSFANKVNYTPRCDDGRFQQHGFKPVKKVKTASGDFVYNFDPYIKEAEYIALPTQDNAQRVTFHRAMKLTILIGQVFGLNPVTGICADDVSQLRFRVYSGRYVYSVFSLVAQGLLVCFCILKIFWENDASLSSNSAIVFYGCNCIVTIQFIKIATKWPRLSRRIAKLESVDPTVDLKIIWKCNITCICIILLAIVEHTLSDLSSISAAIACHPDKHPYDAFLNQNFYWVWKYIPYNTGLGLLTKFISIQCTFNWNYVDVFIICICWYLTARLQQINDKLRKVAGQIVPKHFWRTMREDYTKATNLVRQIDEVVSGVIFVSFASNLFSICILLLHTLEEGLTPTSICDVPSEKRLLGGYEHAAFFLYSISFLIIRALLMSLIAARVNSTSAQAAIALYDVPSVAYNVEVQRFLDQVHGSSVALSGMQFFTVKRGIVLTIAASIVTYELVLIQFAGVTPSNSS